MNTERTTDTTVVVTVELWPTVMLEGLAVQEATLGGVLGFCSTATLAEALAVPPRPSSQATVTV